MRIPFQRAGIVVAVAALVLVAVDLTLIQVGSSARSAGSSAHGSVRAAGRGGVAGSLLLDGQRLECVEAADARAGQRLVELPASAAAATDDADVAARSADASTRRRAG